MLQTLVGIKLYDPLVCIGAHCKNDVDRLNLVHFKADLDSGVLDLTHTDTITQYIYIYIYIYT